MPPYIYVLMRQKRRCETPGFGGRRIEKPDQLRKREKKLIGPSKENQPSTNDERRSHQLPDPLILTKRPCTVNGGAPI